MRAVVTYRSDVASSYLVISELGYETGFSYATVPTQEHLEQVVIVTIHMTGHCISGCVYVCAVGHQQTQ